MKNFAFVVAVGLMSVTQSNIAHAQSNDARGLSCLHCGYTETDSRGRETSKSASVRIQSQEIAETIGSAGLRKPAINFLCDDTFGFNAPRFKRLIDALGGESPHVEFYLLNGPGQRRWSDNKGHKFYNGFGTDIKPATFRDLVKHDANTRQEIINHYRRVEPLCRYVVAKGGHCFITPMLEDNLDDAAFMQIVTLLVPLAQQAGLPVHWVRNPCPDCGVQGNGNAVPSGWHREIHTDRASSLQNTIAAIATNDGDPVSDYCDLFPLAKRTGELGGLFLAWDREAQGVAPDGNLPRPRDRTYVRLSTKQKQQARKLLTATRSQECK